MNFDATTGGMILGALSVSIDLFLRPLLPHLMAVWQHNDRPGLCRGLLRFPAVCLAYLLGLLPVESLGLWGVYGARICW